MASGLFEDKDLDFFSANDNLLDGFFDLDFNLQHESLGSSDSSNESNFFDSFDLGQESNPLGLPDFSPIPAQPASYQPNHSWRINSWQPKDAPPVPKSQRLVHRLRPEGAAISSAQLLSIEGKKDTSCISRIGSSTPPATPPNSLHSRRSRPTTPVPSSRRTRRGTKTALRAAISSPKMMNPSTYSSRQDSPSFHEWTERFQRFNLQGQHNLPLSPPSSTKVPQHEQPSRLVIPSSDDVFAPAYSAASDRTPSTTSTQIPSGHEHDLFTTLQEPSLPWNASAADLNFSSNTAWDTTNANSNTSNNTFNHFFEDTDFTAASSSHAFGPIDPSFATSGLMIQCEPFAALDADVANDLIDPHTIPSLPTQDDEDESPDSGSMSPHTNLFTTMPRTQPPSPCPSPSTPSKRRRSGRRGTSCAKNASEPRTPRTPRTPRSAGAGAGGMGFVNFTPHDSRKILTGVAPSGSSKTKARREREASEKRKRLSEKAAKLVKDAGGDLEELRREGLLM